MFIDSFIKESNVSHHMLLAQQTSTLNLGVVILQTFAVLVLIGAMAWAFVRFVAPRMGMRAGRSRMKILERLPLEPRRSLYLVEVDGKSILVGVSEGSIRLLREVQAPVAGAVEDGEEQVDQ
jgi:flagellar biosynthetic protein FliO